MLSTKKFRYSIEWYLKVIKHLAQVIHKQVNPDLEKNLGFTRNVLQLHATQQFPLKTINGLKWKLLNCSKLKEKTMRVWFAEYDI